jgi:thiol:disulfide interchange protein
MRILAILAIVGTAHAAPDSPAPAAEPPPAPAPQAEPAAEPAKKVSPHEGWTADLEKALGQARKENKLVLVEFTGSDWCPPCMFMREKVFSKKEFVAKASEKFVLVEIDMPRGDQETAKKNEPTVRKFKVRGFPTIVLLDADGKEFSRFVEAEHRDIGSFLKRLDAEIEKKDLD